MVGGLITSTILTLEIVPAIYSIWRGRQVQWEKGPRPPRKKWDELSREFVAMERQLHGDALVPEGPETAPTTETTPSSGKRRSPVVWLTGVLLGILASFLVWHQMRNKQPGSSQEPTPASVTNASPQAALPQLALTPTEVESLTRATYGCRCHYGCSLRRQYSGIQHFGAGNG